MMQWLRLYHDVLDDLKVQGLPSEDFKNWINVLIVASQNHPRGELPSPADLAFFLRLSQEHAEALCARLRDRELLDVQDGRLVIHGWAERQYESDDSTERVRNFRRRKRRNVSGNVSGNVSVTAPDTDTDTEQKQTRGRPEQKSGSQPLAFSGTHLDITQKQDTLLAEAFPWVDRPHEYYTMDSWLEANPDRRPKVTSRFVHNWMSKIKPAGNGSSHAQKMQRGNGAGNGRTDGDKSFRQQQEDRELRLLAEFVRTGESLPGPGAHGSLPTGKADRS